MNKELMDEVWDKHILELCSISSELFRKVSRHTRNEIQAWVVVQGLLRRLPPTRAPANESAPVNEGQLDFLHGLGIHNLKDLTWKHAVALTDYVLAERRAEEGY